MQKADLRRHLEQVHSNPELEQWFDPLAVHVDGETREIRVTFPHIFFSRRFRGKIQTEIENYCLPLLQGWSVRWFEPSTAPAATRHNVVPEAVHSKGIPFSKHTFGSFLYNRKNDFPVAAAKACAAGVNNQPYVPLVIYGQSGAGKTHLLGAIANEAKEYAPDLNFFFGTALDLPLGTSFKAVFLDDLQHVHDQELQRRIVFLLDALAGRGGTFVCTLDASPALSQVLTPELAQRLGAGLVVELKKPDIEVRRRYASGLCDAFHVDADKEQTLALAQRCMDIRAIDGAVNRIRAYASLMPGKTAGPVDILDAGAEQKTLTPEQIISVCARFFSLGPEYVTGKNRDKTAAEARRYAVMLCRELLGLSLPQLGRIFGGRDHSSIVYLLKKFNEIQQENTDTHNTFSRLKQMCLNPAS